jgi:hypothetical protein
VSLQLRIGGRRFVGAQTSYEMIREDAMPHGTAKMAVLRLRLHDLPREDIQLTIFLFPHFGNLEGTNLIAAHH